MTITIETHRNPRPIYRAIYQVLFVYVALCTILLAGPDVSARPLIIEGVSEPPLKWLSPDGPKGIDVDIMTTVLGDMGINDFTFHFVDTGNRLLHNAEHGFSDIVLTLSRNIERSKYLQYPNEAHLLLDWRFVIRAEDARHIRFEDFRDLAPYRIGAATGYSYTPAFWKAELNIETVARNDLLIPMLLENRFDVVPVNYLSTVYDTIQTGKRDQLTFLFPPLRRAAYYNPFSKASDYPDKDGFLENYDRTIRAMRDDGRLLTILERYLGQDGLDWWQSQYQQ